ncbi:MAG TPA: AI-2E family transporter [Thermoanaerobaculia bacterium]|nr:AI-2E family transporter [Thermoanaerobaculia bacterium]
MATYARDERRASEMETFAKKVGIIAAFAAVIALLWFVREVLLLIFIAAALAAGIAPAVHRVRVYGRFYLHRNINRGTAVMLVYFPFLAAMVTLLLLLVPRLMADWQMLSAQMPVLIDRNILQPLERFVSMKPVRDALHQGISVQRSTVLVYVKHVATAVASVVAVFFMVAYMLIDATRLRNLILLFYPAEVRGDKRAMLNRMARRMTSWLAGQMILAAIVGVATFFFLLFLRLPYALPLAILAMFGEMVPIIGPIVGTAPSLAIALLYSKWQFWSMLAFALLLQKFENLFIAPRVMSNKVHVSPLAIFIAFMIGGSLLGIVGALLAVPCAAIIQVAFDEAFVSRRERRQDVDRAGTLLRRVD